ncbi:hypothetical protein J7M28_14385 [bacterium]|nr:hypothetical protein [bacterium]
MGPRFKGVLSFLIVLSVFFSSIVFVLRKSDAMVESYKFRSDMVFVPSPALTKIACLGFDNLLSDLLWLRTIMYVHNQQKGAKRFSWLKQMLDVVTELDPYPCDIYERGGAWLYQDAERPNDGVRFFQKGIRNVPQTAKTKWKLAYHLGQCFRNVLYDEKDATRYFEMAMKMPDAPKVLMVAVAAGYERQGLFDKAQKLWEKTRETTGDPNIARAADDKIRFIEDTRQAIESLQQKVNQFQDKFGHPPDDLQALVDAGYIPSVPEPPLLGKYEFDQSEGRVRYLFIPQELAGLH